MKVSVIIPIYNLEKYIEKSVYSILNQEFDQGVEIIAVDDGSIDGSRSIIERLSKEDPRVKFVFKENGGVSSARNAGIDVAKGQYIVFVDGDDVLFPNALKKLVDAYESEQNAILACGTLKRINEYNQKINESNIDITIEDSKEIIKKILDESYSVSACAKLFERKFIKDIRFIQGKKINEDKYFLFEYLLKNKGVVVDINSCVYGYYIREGSATNSSFSYGSLDMLFFSAKIEEDIQKNIPELMEAARYNNLVSHLAVLKKIIRSGDYKTQKDLFKDVRKNALILNKKISKEYANTHNVEVIALGIGCWAYIVCVKLFDVLKNKAGVIC